MSLSLVTSHATGFAHVGVAVPKYIVKNKAQKSQNVCCDLIISIIGSNRKKLPVGE